MRILLLEDDLMIGTALQTGLRRGGLTVDWLRDGEHGLQAACTEPFDLMVLDLGLPRCDGLDVLRTLRQRKNDLPVIVVTARDAVAQRIAGLNAGADDYLSKPFDLNELLARIHAVLRRKAGRADVVVRWGDLEINQSTRQVLRGGQPVNLSAKEYQLLELLLAHIGVPISRAQMEERLYGWGEEVESNVVEVHIFSLRKKLGANLIQNQRGVGYLIPREGNTA